MVKVGLWKRGSNRKINPRPAQKMKGPSGLASRFGAPGAGGAAGAGGALKGFLSDGGMEEAEEPPRFPDLILVGPMPPKG